MWYIGSKSAASQNLRNACVRIRRRHFRGSPRNSVSYREIRRTFSTGWRDLSPVGYGSENLVARGNYFRSSSVDRRKQLCSERVVGNTALFTSDFDKFYKYHNYHNYNIAQCPRGTRTPCSNRAETAVRLFKKTWVLFVKSLGEEGMFEKITLRQTVKSIVLVRNCQRTVSSYSPLEVATGRRPPDLLDVETSNPEQLSLERLPEDRTATQLLGARLSSYPVLPFLCFAYCNL